MTANNKNAFLKFPSVIDLDMVQYNIQEEYETNINFEALDTMDPNILAGIDMDMIATLTNTDPRLLDKYRETARRSSSIKDNPLHTSHESLHRHYSLTLQATLKKNSLESSTGPVTLKRSNTMSDVHSCSVNTSLPVPSITMKVTRSESKGSMFVVESQDTKEFRSPMNLLRVLSLSMNTARRGSRTELSETDEDMCRLDAEILSCDEGSELEKEAADEAVAKWEEVREEVNRREEAEEAEDSSSHFIRMFMETPV